MIKYRHIQTFVIRKLGRYMQHNCVVYYSYYYWNKKSPIILLNGKSVLLLSH